MSRRWIVPPSAVEEARQVVGDLKETLLEKIKNSDWIKDTMWCLMFGKARNMRLITGYPKEFATESLVENFYAGFPTTGPSDFFTPYFESHRILTTRFHTENVTDNFTTGVATAFYNGGRNKVIILPDLLKPPVFIHGGPAAINYGGLGQAVGHEMMHGFDVGNIEFSYQNSKRDLQRTWTMREYNKKVLCLRASYQRAETHSRARTLDEHIDSEGFADFAGVLLAYEAYRRLPDHVLSRAVPHVGLNADQLFFVFHCLKWCSTTSERRRDPASPYWRSRSRCIVPLQNMPEFAKAFYCKQGDLMNPAERCSFW
ncbi:neprilysin-1-like [Amblyomma americanum]